MVTKGALKDTKRSKHRRRQRDYSGSDVSDNELSEGSNQEKKQKKRVRIDIEDINDGSDDESKTTRYRKSIVPKGNRNSIISTGDYRIGFANNAKEKQFVLFKTKLRDRGPYDKYDSKVIDAIYNSADFMNINVDSLVRVLSKLYQEENYLITLINNPRSFRGETNQKELIKEIKRFVSELSETMSKKKKTRRMDHDEQMVLNKIEQIEKAAEVLKYLRVIMDTIWNIAEPNRFPTRIVQFNKIVFDLSGKEDNEPDLTFAIDEVEEDENDIKVSDEERDLDANSDIDYDSDEPIED